MKFTIFMHHFHMGYAMAFHYDICCLQHKVTCVAQYELISQTSDNEVVDHHGSINATVCWGRHSALLQEPPLDVIATLVTTILLCFSLTRVILVTLHLFTTKTWTTAFRGRKNRQTDYITAL